MTSRNNKGFTLIELIMVIAILGILAAIAIPNYVDLTTEARQATVDGIAGSLGSASAINYAVCQTDNAACQDVADCTDVATLLASGAMPTGYVITSATITAGATASCEVTITGESETANFTGHGVTQ